MGQEQEDLEEIEKVKTMTLKEVEGLGYQVPSIWRFIEEYDRLENVLEHDSLFDHKLSEEEKKKILKRQDELDDIIQHCSGL